MRKINYTAAILRGRTRRAEGEKKAGIIEHHSARQRFGRNAGRFRT